MPAAFNELLKVREMGNKKYDRLNWNVSKGTDHHQEFMDDNIDSIFRHLIDYITGDKYDDESKCHHLAHVAVRCMFALEYDDV